MTALNILRIDSSSRGDDSVSRQLATRLISTLETAHTSVNVTRRDLRQVPTAVTETWIGSAYTPEDERTAEQRVALVESDTLIEEIQSADVIVIAAPIYNFAVPSALKAWIDQICRVGVTFSYSDTGPIGLLEGKRVIIVTTSGGTATDGPMDFAIPYLRHVLGFVGLSDVDVIAADQLMVDSDAAMAKAAARIEGWATAA